MLEISNSDQNSILSLIGKMARILKSLFFAKECKIVDGATEVAIIKETCLAGVVDVQMLGSVHDESRLEFSYKSFAVDSFSEGESRTQTLKCSLQLCLNDSCASQYAASDSTCPTTLGFEYGAP